jgi:methyl-accepting chemotaxis protein
MKLKLGQKILLMIFVIVFTSMAGVTLISISKSSKSLTDVAETDLEHLTKMALNSCEVAHATVSKKLVSDINVAELYFQDVSNNSVMVENGQMILDYEGSNKVINGDFEYVDEIEKRTGSTCTVFMKDGDKARRISTNVLKEDGSRAVGTFVSQPVYDAVIKNGQSFRGRAWVVTDWYMTIYEPIRDINNNIVGILYVGVKEKVDVLSEGLLAQKVGETGYIYCINSKGVLQVHPAKEGADISKYEFIQEMMSKGPKLGKGQIEWISYPWINKELGETKARDKIVSYAYFENWDWIIAVGSYMGEFVQPINSLKSTLLLIGMLFMVGSMIMGYLFSRSISKPIVKLVDVAEAVAIGDVSQSVEIKSSDEIGTLAKSFESMIDYLQSTSQIAEKIATNDLCVKVEPKSDKDALGLSFQSMVNNLSEMIHNIKDNANELVSAASEIAASSEQISHGAQEQTDQVTQVSTAIEEMSATIIESAKNASEATESSRGASDSATSGGVIVSDTITGMLRIADVVRQSSESIGKLSESANQIGEIINVINDIADQTNLLALNAAIEAARAGEQGRGFAVVADEVRKLAERTGKATNEIAEMIKGIQSETEEAVNSMNSGIEEVDKGKELADKAGNSLTDIVNLSGQVMDMIQQIATASEEQSSAAEEISKRVDGIANVTKESSNGAQQAAVAAEELSRQADGLQNLVSQFKVEDTITESSTKK